jgi:hypothetical protein
MILHNRTLLDAGRLEPLLLRHVEVWPHGSVRVYVRYSRSAAFSGSCYYDTGNLYINIGRNVHYPYQLPARIAKAQTRGRYWFRPVHFVLLQDAYQLVLYVFLHEFYHWLVKQAGRNLRQKEAMCDRFAARILVDCHEARVLDKRGKSVPRSTWDWQNVEAFVRAAAAGRVGAVRE